MRYEVVCGGKVIGRSELEHADPSMGVLYGRFYPTGDYKQVRPVFLLFHGEAPGQVLTYYQQRDALGLVVRRVEGPVVPAETVHIEDYLEELGECQIHVHTHGTAASEALHA